MEDNESLEMGRPIGGNFLAEDNVGTLDSFTRIFFFGSVVVEGKNPAAALWRHRDNKHFFYESVTEVIWVILDQITFACHVYNFKMAAIVPYRTGFQVARRAYMLSRMFDRRRRRTRLAARVIGAAWRNRRGIKRTGRAIYRAAKRSKFSVRKHGEAVGSSVAKSHTAVRDGTVQEYNTKTLYIENLWDVPHDNNNGVAKNERLRLILNARGVSIKGELRNNFTEHPLYINMAVVIPKNNLTVTEENFFRSYGNSRGENFPTGLQDKTGLELHTHPINTDKYTVVRHKRYKLDPVNSVSLNHRGRSSNSLTYNWYLKYKRQLRFDDADNDVPTDGNMVFCLWCSQAFSSQTQAVQTAAMTGTQSIRCFFKESNACGC